MPKYLVSRRVDLYYWEVYLTDAEDMEAAEDHGYGKVVARTMDNYKPDYNFTGEVIDENYQVIEISDEEKERFLADLKKHGVTECRRPDGFDGRLDPC